MKPKLNTENALKIAEKLKLIILNEPEMDVRIAVEKLRKLVTMPELWASDWAEKG